MVNGAIRNGVTYMPKFDGIVKQEGLWAIRSWLESVSVDAPVKAAAPAATTAAAPAASAAPVTPAVARTGEQVFNTVCTACHTAGILNAPKIDDKAAWEPRAAKGLSGLLASSTTGLNQMPAKGGDPSLTEQELSEAITYMLGKAGIDLSKAASAAAATPTTTAPAKPATN
ncbi:MAG: cytochrome c5 family protein [Thiothrix sp.]|nr:MAG: cytochrome c5 family protein [Thiothrix sp.]